MPLMSSDLGAFSAVGPRLRMIQGGMRRLAAAQKRRYRSFPISAVGLEADLRRHSIVKHDWAPKPDIRFSDRIIRST